MYLYLFWLFPALIFLLFFMSDRRRLFNAYLFSINLGLLLLISAFFTSRTNRVMVQSTNCELLSL